MLLVRTGHLAKWWTLAAEDDRDAYFMASPGVSRDAIPWLHEHCGLGAGRATTSASSSLVPEDPEDARAAAARRMPRRPRACRSASSGTSTPWPPTAPRTAAYEFLLVRPAALPAGRHGLAAQPDRPQVAPWHLTAADDGFHPGASEDRSWTETAWFAAPAPERGLCVWTYPLFRHELGVMSCGIYVWGPGAEELWELPYYRTWWHLPIPDGIEADPLRASRTASPTSASSRSPPTGSATPTATSIALDITFRALHPPHEVGVVPGGHGHLDQLGRVTGELQLNGERLEIDCVEMRDRTWSPRRESRQGTYPHLQLRGEPRPARLPRLHPLQPAQAAGPRC